MRLTSESDSIRERRMTPWPVWVSGFLIGFGAGGLATVLYYWDEIWR